MCVSSRYRVAVVTSVGDEKEHRELDPTHPRIRLRLTAVHAEYVAWVASSRVPSSPSWTVWRKRHRSAETGRRSPTTSLLLSILISYRNCPQSEKRRDRRQVHELLRRTTRRNQNACSLEMREAVTVSTSRRLCRSQAVAVRSIQISGGTCSPPASSERHATRAQSPQ
jgi:hypothetical protein